MILDEPSIERGALAALDSLNAEERERFEHDLGLNSALAECTAEFRDIVAGVALAGCQRLEAPPLRVLTGALERIGAVRAPAAPPRRRWSGSWLALAACAAVLMLVGGGVSTFLNNVSDGADERDEMVGGAAGEDGDRVVIMRNGETLATMKAGDRALAELLEKLSRMERLQAAPDVIQDIARLKRELKSLRRVDAERFAAGPRVARTVYIEMVEPGAEAETGSGNEEKSGLSERVSDYIATAIGLDLSAVEAGTTSGVAAPIIFEPEVSGELPELGGIGSETPFFYRGFPIGHDHFERIDEQRAWDRDNNRIWIETDEPGLFQAFVPPDGFDPDFFEDFAGRIPLGGTLPAPVMVEKAEPAPAPVIEQAPLAQVDAAPARAPAPVAVTVYEQTTGRGSVIIGNLAPAGDGRAYQLWMRNAADDRVVSVGMLPEIAAGSERFDFDLLGPGITPAGFFVTLEPEGGVGSPSANIILQGP